jgi:hypothetical protein
MKVQPISPFQGIASRPDLSEDKFFRELFSHFSNEEMKEIFALADSQRTK